MGCRPAAGVSGAGAALVIKYPYMQPQQPGTVYGPPSSPSTPPANTGQYDFILNYGANKKSPLPSVPVPGQSSVIGRILVAVGGGIVLLIAAWIFFGIIIAKKPAVDPAAFTTIAQRQTELARISLEPAQNATGLDTKNFAATVQLSLLTDQETIVSLLQKYGVKLNQTMLAGRKNSQTDAALQQAQASGTYDQAYIAAAQSQLHDYEQELKQTFNATTNATARQVLNNDYTHAQLLDQLSKQTSS